jgi:hypothetical protein
MPTNAETDPFFELLTDALRAGPGSPQWRDAVAELRSKGAGEADEYRLLINTRESLEGGRDFRSVRAGTGFTRKLMDGLRDQEHGGGRSSLPIANIIAIICGLAIVGALAFVIYRAAAPTGGADQQAIEQLAGEANHFLGDITAASFAGAAPEGWKQIGSLPLDFNGELRPAADTPGQGGGVYYATAIPAQTSFMIETSIEVAKPSDAVWLQTFVATDANFSPDRATAAHEIVWSLQGAAQNIVVDGNVKPAAQKPPAGNFPIRLIINRDLAIVLVGHHKPDGKLEYEQVWAGAHHLGSADRYIGVRFLRTRSSNDQPPGVAAVHVSKG